jgi:hypothetical protein
MHGQYVRSIDSQYVSEEDMILWLLRGDLQAETESETVAAQEQTLQTKYCATKILHTETDRKCRLCQEFDETVNHVTSACPIPAKEKYTDTTECALKYTSIYARKYERKIGERALV